MKRFNRLPRPGAEHYDEDLNRWLREWYDEQRQDISDIQAAPVFYGTLPSPQTILSANTWTVVQIVSTVDTHGWWSSSTHAYTPKKAGYYNVSWGVGIHDTTAVATSTYGRGTADLGNVETVAYGNGAALDVPTMTASAVRKCNGSTDSIQLQGLLFTGTLGTFYAGRCWLSINYSGS